MNKSKAKSGVMQLSQSMDSNIKLELRLKYYVFITYLSFLLIQIHNKNSITNNQKDLNSGGSKDWTTGYLKIKYSYGLELRPGQKDPDYS